MQHELVPFDSPAQIGLDLQLFDRGRAADPVVAADVARIIADVRTEGDDCLRALAREYDGAELDQLEVPRAECDAAPRTPEGAWTPCFIGEGVNAAGGVNTVAVTPQQYYVLREHGTERAGTRPLNYEKSEGTYVCAG